MRAARIAVATIALLAIAGCAPQSMAPEVLPLDAADVKVAKTTVKAPGDNVAFEAQGDEVAAGAGVAVEAAPTVEVQADRTPEMTWQRNTQPESGWKNLHVDNVAYSDVERLEAVSPAFRAYIQNAMSAADTDGCTVLELSIMGTHPEGFILGTVSTDCGGGQAIWASAAATGEWRLVTLLQAAPECVTLEELEMPPGLGLLCMGSAGSATEY